MARYWGTIGACAFAMMLHTSEIYAGTIRDDVLDDSYTALAAQPEFAAVGLINSVGLGNGSGTLVESRWVLTAAHVISFPNPSAVIFKLNGVDYTAGDWLPHPAWNDAVGINGYDLALVRLTVAVNEVTPAVRYTGTNELGSTATIVGYGQTGTGLTGAPGQNPPVLPQTYSGTKRAGQNVLDAVGSAAGNSNNYLMADFDNPHSAADSSWGSDTPLPLEYCAAPGDSGGGVFIVDEGVQKLAGVVSFGENGPVDNRDASANDDYGDLMGITRISTLNDWIDGQIAASYWANTAGGSFGDAGNWEDAHVPGTDKLAVFNKAGTYTVQLDGGMDYQSVHMGGGTVTFDLNSHSHTINNTAAGWSLVIGRRDRDDATLVLSGGGTLNAADVVISQSSNSKGQLEIISGASLNVSGSVLVGALGPIQIGYGALNVRSGASLNVAGKLIVISSGTATLDSNLTSIGSIELAGGTIDGSGELRISGVSSWKSGTFRGTGITTIAAGGTLNLSGVSAKSMDGRAFPNFGTINWSGGDFTGTNGAVINNAAGAIFNAQGNASMTTGSGTMPTFNNAGLYRKSAGDGLANVAWQFNNTGTMQVDSGTLRFTGEYTQSNASARILLNGGILAKTGTLVIQAGTIEGNGSIAAASVENYGKLLPGLSAGSLTFDGSLSLQNTSQIMFELGGVAQGTNFDFIDVNGNFTAGGLLHVLFLNNFQSSILPTDSFVLLTSNSAINGAFQNIADGMRLRTADGFGSFLVRYGAGGNPTNLELSAFLPAQSGDFDGDQDVDGADFVAWQTHFPLATGATLAQGDADGDGDVDGADFVVWQTNFPTTAGAAITAVPEPAAAYLALPAILAGILASRHCRGNSRFYCSWSAVKTANST